MSSCMSNSGSDELEGVPQTTATFFSCVYFGYMAGRAREPGRDVPAPRSWSATQLQMVADHCQLVRLGSGPVRVGSLEHERCSLRPAETSSALLDEKRAAI